MVALLAPMWVRDPELRIHQTSLASRSRSLTVRTLVLSPVHYPTGAPVRGDLRLPIVSSEAKLPSVFAHSAGSCQRCPDLQGMETVGKGHKEF